MKERVIPSRVIDMSWKDHCLSSCEIWIRSLPPTLRSCVTLDKLLNLSEPHSPRLKVRKVILTSAS